MPKKRNPNAISVLRSLGRAFAVFFLVNLIALIFRSLRLGFAEISELSFHNGMFIINGQGAGLRLGSTAGNLLILTAFVISMIGYYRKEMVTLKKQE